MGDYRDGDPTSPFLSSLEHGYSKWMEKNYQTYGSLNDSDENEHLLRGNQHFHRINHGSHLQHDDIKSPYSTSNIILYLRSKFRSALRSTLPISFPSISDHMCDAKHDYLSVKQLQSSLPHSPNGMNLLSTDHEPGYIASSQEYNPVDIKLLVFNATSALYLSCVMGCFIFLLTTLLQFLYTTLNYFHQYGTILKSPPIFVPFANVMRNIQDNDSIPSTYLDRSLIYLSTLYRYISWTLLLFILCVLVGVAITAPLSRFLSRKFILRASYVILYIAITTVLLFLFTNTIIIPGNDMRGGSGGIFSAFIYLRQGLSLLNRSLFQQITHTTISFPFISPPATSSPPSLQDGPDPSDIHTTITPMASSIPPTAPFFFLISLLYVLIILLCVITIGCSLGTGLWTLSSYIGELAKPIRRSQLGYSGLFMFLIGLLIASMGISRVFYHIINTHTHLQYHLDQTEGNPPSLSPPTEASGLISLTSGNNVLFLFLFLTVLFLYNLYALATLPESPLWMMFPNDRTQSSQKLSVKAGKEIVDMFNQYMAQKTGRPQGQWQGQEEAHGHDNDTSSKEATHHNGSGDDGDTAQDMISHPLHSRSSTKSSVAVGPPRKRNDPPQSKSKPTTKTMAGRKNSSNSVDNSNPDEYIDDIIIDIDTSLVERTHNHHHQVDPHPHPLPTDPHNKISKLPEDFLKPECCRDEEQVLLPKGIPRYHEHECTETHIAQALDSPQSLQHPSLLTPDSSPQAPPHPSPPTSPSPLPAPPSLPSISALGRDGYARDSRVQPNTHLQLFLHQHLPHSVILHHISTHEQLLLLNLTILRRRCDIGFESASLALYALQVVRSYDMFSHGYSTHSMHWINQLLQSYHDSSSYVIQHHQDVGGDDSDDDSHGDQQCRLHAHPQSKPRFPHSLLSLDSQSRHQMENRHQMASLASQPADDDINTSVATTTSGDQLRGMDMYGDALGKNPSKRPPHGVMAQWDLQSLASVSTSQLFQDKHPHQPQSHSVSPHHTRQYDDSPHIHGTPEAFLPSHQQGMSTTSPEREQTPIQMLLSIPFSSPARDSHHAVVSPHANSQSPPRYNSNPVNPHTAFLSPPSPSASAQDNHQSSSFINIIPNSLPFFFPLSMWVSYRKHIIPMLLMCTVVMCCVLVITLPSLFIPHHLMAMSATVSVPPAPVYAHGEPQPPVSMPPPPIPSQSTISMASFIDGEIPKHAYDPPKGVKQKDLAQSLISPGLLIRPNPQYPSTTPSPSNNRTKDVALDPPNNVGNDPSPALDQQQRQEAIDKAIALYTLHRHLFSNTMLVSLTMFSSYTQLLLVCAVSGTIIGCLITVLSYYCNSAIFLVQPTNPQTHNDDDEMNDRHTNQHEDGDTATSPHLELFSLLGDRGSENTQSSTHHPQRGNIPPPHHNTINVQQLCTRPHQHSSSGKDCVIGYGASIRSITSLILAGVLIICTVISIITLVYHDGRDHDIAFFKASIVSNMISPGSPSPSSSSLGEGHTHRPGLLSTLCPYLIPSVVFCVFASLGSSTLVMTLRRSKLPPFILATLLPTTMTLGGILSVVIIAITINLNNRIRMLWFCVITLSCCGMLIFDQLKRMRVQSA